MFENMFAGLFSIGNLVDLLMLVLLQAVLGFDNLLYISLESQRAPEHMQKSVRRMGIIIAMVLRIVLLFLLVQVIALFQDSLFKVNIPNIMQGDFNLHAIIVLFGGVFILYTAVKEVLHMMRIEMHDHEDRNTRPVALIVTSIVAMNVVFSFDSILSAMAISDYFIIMAIAIMIGAALMLLLADTVSEFLKKNRMYEVLGLFILFIVGILLLTEGAHLAHLEFFNQPITPMTKMTFYFVIFVLVIVEIVQGRYQQKLLADANKGQAHHS